MILIDFIGKDRKLLLKTAINSYIFFLLYFTTNFLQQVPRPSTVILTV